MKNQLLALATLCPLAGFVHAQSSVTLYGLIDEGFEAVSNVPVASKTGGGTRHPAPGRLVSAINSSAAA